MRCMTLADKLVAAGAGVSFICRKCNGAMLDVIAARGYSSDLIDESVSSSESDAVETERILRERYPDGIDWLVVDHYGLDARWETLVRSVSRNVMVIDDLANRSHDCDLLLDQNFYADLGSRYVGLVPDSARCLLGPAHVLLRPEFVAARKGMRRRSGRVRKVLVFFGSTDPTNQTLHALHGIDLLRLPDVRVDVVVGNANPHREQVRDFCEIHRWASFHCQVTNMAELIAAADLGIGAGGAAMWERCVLGLPTLTVVFADNQFQTTHDVAATGAIAYLGWAGNLSAADYADAIRMYLDRPDDLASISTAALRLIDASGNGAESVISAMTEIVNSKVNE